MCGRYLELGRSAEAAHCAFLASSETTARGTGLGSSAGEADPVELESTPALRNDVGGVRDIRGSIGDREIYHFSSRYVSDALGLKFASARVLV